MKEIPLTRGKVALVDDQDFEWLCQYKWHAARMVRANKEYFYAATKVRGKRVYMHRLILGAPKGFDVDHRNGDTLKCNRDNLRIATKSQNQGNSFPTAASSSSFKGVSWDKLAGKWRAGIRRNRKSKFLGHFTFEEDASRAYAAAAKEFFGEFARS